MSESKTFISCDFLIPCVKCLQQGVQSADYRNRKHDEMWELLLQFTKVKIPFKQQLQPSLTDLHFLVRYKSGLFIQVCYEFRSKPGPLT